MKVWHQAVKRFIIPYLLGHCVNKLLDIVEKTTLETYLHVPTQGPENWVGWKKQYFSPSDWLFVAQLEQPIRNEHPMVAAAHPQLIDFNTYNNSKLNIPIFKTQKQCVSLFEETYTLMVVVLWALAVLFQSFLAKYHLSIPMSPLGEAVTHNINKTMILTRHRKFGVRFEVIMVKNTKNTHF